MRIAIVGCTAALVLAALTACSAAAGKQEQVTMECYTSGVLTKRLTGDSIAMTREELITGEYREVWVVGRHGIGLTHIAQQEEVCGPEIRAPPMVD